jgi:predicted aminopeptidase
MSDEELKLQARELWIKGESKYNIAKAVGRRRSTVENWANEGNWREAKQETTNQIIQQQNIDLILEKERSLKLIKAAESLFAQELKNSTVMPKSVPAFAQLQKVKWDILMPRTVSQFNFMKQENNSQIGLSQEELNRLMEVLNANTKGSDL